MGAPQPPLAQVETSIDDDVVVARVVGEVDMSNAIEVQDRLLGAVPASAHGLAIDLAELAYLDSAGVRLLFELQERLSRRGQGLRLAVPAGSHVRRVLLLTRLDTLVALDEDVAASIAAIRSSV
ncbi:MAG: STAS domain-containing protein [Thermoleophilia bacterium]